MPDRVHTSPEQSAYRWVIVVAAALMLAVVMGQIVNGISVYFIPLEAEFGWARGSVAFMNTIGLIGIAIGGIVMGSIADRIGIRRVALLGAVVTAATGLIAGQLSALWQFYALFFVAGFLGAGSMFAPLIALVGNWFLVGAGLAIGIASAGQALGQGGVPFGTSFLIEALGWRGAFTAQGVISFLLLVPLALLLRDPPESPLAQTASEETPEVLPGNVVVVWLSAAVVLCCTCMAVPLMHLVPHITAICGSATEASGVLFTLLLVAIAGRVAFGRLADVIGAIPAYFVASLWQTVLVFGFVLLSDLNHFYIFAVIYGFGYAGVMTAVLITVRELAPVSWRATATGIVFAFGWLGHGLGGFQGGLFYDLTGSYTQTFANAAIAGVLNLLLVGALLITVRRRRAALVAA